MGGDWVREETRGVQLGDERLNKRLATLLEQFGGQPEASIPQACGGKAETEAAYRFFDNGRVAFEGILEPHARATVRRMAEYPRVIVVQDTTEIELTRPEQQVVGAGPLDEGSRRGLFLHPLVAYSPEGTPLGTLHASVWTRDEPTPSSRDKRRPIEEKESLRWITAFDRARAAAAELPETRVVHVSDSESDVYELLERTADGRVDWILRAGQNRRLVPVAEPLLDDAGEPVADRLRERLLAAEPMFETTVSTRRRRAKVACETRRRRTPRDPRTATVVVRAARVVLRPPARAGRRPPTIAVNAVLALESDPPAGEEAVDWLLLTNLSIDDDERVREIVATYRVRWQIEVFFQTLKSGPRPEERRFEHVARHRRALAVWLIVTWRTLFVCRLAREFPEASCEVVFEEPEWRSVLAVVHRDPSPRDPPTLRDAVRLVASLGGYLDRPGRGDPPGAKTVWRGLQRLHDFTLCWQTFGPAPPQTGGKVV